MGNLRKDLLFGFIKKLENLGGRLRRTAWGRGPEAAGQAREAWAREAGQGGW